jgi:hypothetical protein
MSHSLQEMIAEAAKLHARDLTQVIEHLQWCTGCLAEPVAIILRPPSFEVELISPPVLRMDMPASNPFFRADNSRVQITTVMELLCEGCARIRLAGQDVLGAPGRSYHGTITYPVLGITGIQI